MKFTVFARYTQQLSLSLAVCTEHTIMALSFVHIYERIIAVLTMRIQHIHHFDDGCVILEMLECLNVRATETAKQFATHEWHLCE